MLRKIVVIILISFTLMLTSHRTALAYEYFYTKNGNIVQWWESCVYYSIHEDGVPGLNLEDVRRVVHESFQVWEDAPCSYLRFIETDFASCGELGFNAHGGNTNLIFSVTEDWEELDTDTSPDAGAKHTPNAVAVTDLRMDETTGEIVDADIHLNAEFFVFTVDAVDHTDSRVANLGNTLTHEIGHLVGLGHSSHFEATMYDAASQTGETKKRTLEQDDIDGICGLYPFKNDPEICEMPFCGLDLDCVFDTCQNDDDHIFGTKTKSCSVSPRLGGATDASLFGTLMKLLFSAD